MLEAARALGYTPNAMASALRAGRTSVVIFALPDWPLGPPVAELLSASSASWTGSATRRSCTSATVRPGRPAKACDRVRPVGLIAPALDLPPASSCCAPTARARIVARAASRTTDVPSFTLEQGRVGEVAIEHLAERGHTRVLAIAPPSPSCSASVSCGSRAREPPRSGSGSSSRRSRRRLRAARRRHRRLRVQRRDRARRARRAARRGRPDRHRRQPGRARRAP